MKRTDKLKLPHIHQMLETCGQPWQNNTNQIASGRANDFKLNVPGDRKVLPAVNSQLPLSPAINDTASDTKVLPSNSQHLLFSAGSQQKRGHEEDQTRSNLSGPEGDGAKRIRKENDESLTQPSEGTKQTRAHPTKESRQKATGTKSKTKVEGEQAITQLEEDGRWSDDDTKLLLETLLGSESEFYEGLIGNAKHVYKKVTKCKVNLQIFVLKLCNPGVCKHIQRKTQCQVSEGTL